MKIYEKCVNIYSKSQAESCRRVGHFASFGRLPGVLHSREVNTMPNRQCNENQEPEPKLSLEKAEEILRNVYQAVGISPPEDCAEILRRGTEKNF